jgi:MerR family mercuric resistance operon transcriptional regulator
MVTTLRGLTIGRLADAAGVNLETIRYYERIKLMPRPGRTRGGHRVYEAEHIRRLVFIRRARELGFGIGDIRALLALAEPKRISCDKVRAIASAPASVPCLLTFAEAILAATVARTAIQRPRARY